jgi:hypothetical protein
MSSIPDPACGNIDMELFNAGSTRVAEDIPYTLKDGARDRMRNSTHASFTVHGSFTTTRTRDFGSEFATQLIFVYPPCFGYYALVLGYRRAGSILDSVCGNVGLYNISGSSSEPHESIVACPAFHICWCQCILVGLGPYRIDGV